MVTVLVEMISALVVVVLLSLVLNSMADGYEETLERLEETYPRPKVSFWKRFLDSSKKWLKGLSFSDVVMYLILWMIVLVVYYSIRVLSSLVLLII